MKWILPLALLAGTVSVVTLSQAAPRAATPARLKAPYAETTTLSRTVATLLQQNDTQGVSRYVDPVRGLRFSPEVYAGKSDVKFSRRQVAGLKNDTKVRVWGTYMGEGGPIRLTWNDYRPKYVTSRDFTKRVRLSVNPKLGGRSTVINNLREFYPGAVYVELYAPSTGPEQMDWSSLWLVWRKSAGTWRLIGIAHDQWST